MSKIHISTDVNTLTDKWSLQYPKPSKMIIISDDGWLGFNPAFLGIQIFGMDWDARGCVLSKEVAEELFNKVELLCKENIPTWEEEHEQYGDCVDGLICWDVEDNKAIVINYFGNMDVFYELVSNITNYSEPFDAAHLNQKIKEYFFDYPNDDDFDGGRFPNFSKTHPRVFDLFSKFPR